jgi:hypothetical protein
VLADPGRRDTDGGRHTGENESHQQHRRATFIVSRTRPA